MVPWNLWFIAICGFSLIESHYMEIEFIIKTVMMSICKKVEQVKLIWTRPWPTKNFRLAIKVNILYLINVIQIIWWTPSDLVQSCSNIVTLPVLNRLALDIIIYYLACEYYVSIFITSVEYRCKNGSSEVKSIVLLNR